MLSRLYSVPFALVALMAASPSVVHADIDTFYAVNQNPFRVIFGLPEPDDLLEPESRLHFSARQEVSNFFSIASDGDEALVLDGELWSTTFLTRVRLNDSFFVGVDVPLLQYRSGVFDEFIIDWHNIFGLPQGGRTSPGVDDNDFQITFVKDGEVIVDVDDNEFGLGDIRLSLGHEAEWFNQLWRVKAEVKLPTGDEENLFGSGGTDVTLSTLVEDSNLFRRYKVTTFLGGGIGILGDTELDLVDEQKSFTWTLRAGFSWAPLTWLTLKQQVDFQREPFDSALRELGEPSVQYTFGGQFNLSESYKLEIGFSEDLLLQASPDITVKVALLANY